MTKTLDKDELGQLLYLVKSDKYALKLILDVLYIGHAWDDFVDGDVQRGVDDINDAFVRTFRDLANNKFFLSLPLQVQWQLNGLLISAAMQFRDSTVLEVGSQEDRLIGWILRNSVKAIVHYVVYLAGGSEWIDEHGLAVWRMFRMAEDWDGYWEEGVNENLIR
jgi:hypothetical protein